MNSVQDQAGRVYWKELGQKGVDQKREVRLPEGVLEMAYIGALASGVKLGNEEEVSYPRIII